MSRRGTDAGVPGTEPGIRVAGLSVDLGGRRVLTGVDLRVASGELVGLLGPNGAGKTTLLRAVLGLVRPHAGTVRIDGRRPAEARALVGYVPQRHEFAWDFPITVEEAVLTGRTARIGWMRRAGAADYRAADEALGRVGMGDLRRRPVGELSGGQRQRVLVARALALAPSALLLDEPFTGLDMPSQELLTDLFARLAREGHAVLMTTHDIAGALHACTRVCLLGAGGVVADGEPAALDDPALWMRAFDVRADNPVLRVVAASARRSAAQASARPAEHPAAQRSAREEDADALAR
ncbi:anchored repeat-type ABC transporter ATP-binding subunit [Microbacterium sp. No. 7]|uniref:anchored repeat-type ABC transporter ATP-binding subunit n=1 Tax=Microbacterium sp. No. 7 TaxID=1714373 RepID=UPI0009EBCA79|nr:anchored repeat-type ABC transporter ATP-binding subunit [Microbacterium sp. No. 7]